MSKIDIILYSCDRTSQLDLLLRSTKEHLLNAGTIYILYEASNEEYNKGFEKVKATDYGLNIKYFKQTDFKAQTLEILNLMESPYFLGLCDDDVFIKPIDTSEIVNKLYDKDVNAISIKSGLNIKYSYSIPLIPLDYPDWIESEPFLKWDWTLYRPDTNWGYPTCVNAYIWLKEYFINLIKDIDFKHPPTLEGGLNTIRKQLKPLMVSTKETKLLNLPINRLQTLSPNPFGQTYNYPVHDLNIKWLNGVRIKTDNIYNISVDVNNKELELNFEVK